MSFVSPLVSFWCIDLNIKFEAPEYLFVGGGTKQQKMMPCYGRREAIIPFRPFINQNEYFNDFLIYPKNITSWMVFKYNSETTFIKLHSWFDNVDLRLVKQDVHKYLPPMSIYDINQKNKILYQLLKNSEKLVFLLIFLN